MPLVVLEATGPLTDLLLATVFTLVVQTELIGASTSGVLLDSGIIWQALKGVHQTPESPVDTPESPPDLREVRRTLGGPVEPRDVHQTPSRCPMGSSWNPVPCPLNRWKMSILCQEGLPCSYFHR